MILLDTQAAIFMTLEKEKLSAAASSAIRNMSRVPEGLALASSSLWEVAMISSKGKFRHNRPLADYLLHLESLFMVLPITGAIAARAVQFSDQYPKDPADRIIGATALVHGMDLITSDELIRRSGEVPCIW
jgi:PIN domain nuclease of toxin-antitoxin system